MKKVTGKLIEAYGKESLIFENHKIVYSNGRKYSIEKAKGFKKLSTSRLIYQVKQECFVKNEASLSTEESQNLAQIFTYIKGKRKKKKSQTRLIHFFIDFFDKLSNWKEGNTFITTPVAIKKLLTKIGEQTAQTAPETPKKKLPFQEPSEPLEKLSSPESTKEKKIIFDLMNDLIANVASVKVSKPGGCDGPDWIACLTDSSKNKWSFCLFREDEFYLYGDGKHFSNKQIPKKMGIKLTKAICKHTKNQVVPSSL